MPLFSRGNDKDEPPREGGDPDAAGGPQSRLSGEGVHDDQPAPFDKEPAGQDTPAGGEGGVRDAAQEESARSAFGGTDAPPDHERAEQDTQRGQAAVVDEEPPNDRSDDDEYRWHTGRQRPTGDGRPGRRPSRAASA